MKYYESTFEEYLRSVNRCTLHPELQPVIDDFPDTVHKIQNIILYGSPGVGKYSQALKLISKYSKDDLKYEKRVAVATDKREKKKQKTVTNIANATTTTTSSSTTVKTTKSQNSHNTKMIALPSKTSDYSFRMSDIHFEIDMSLLGCNSKTLWHEMFFQIVDIVSLKQNKVGIIMCKNFHNIYNELLDIFYSYMQHPVYKYNIEIRFVILTEHIGFIPNEIMNSCACIGIQRPSKELYNKCICEINPEMLDDLDITGIVNAKEFHHLKRLKSFEEVPTELFDTVTEELIGYLKDPEKLTNIKLFRNHLYDLLVFNIDVTEAFRHILFTCIQSGMFHSKQNITNIVSHTFVFLKYYNNNYRSIYHLENMFFYILNEIHGFERGLVST